MKKIISLILCLLMCFSLCSCKKFKELKEKHAVFDQGGIVYKDVLYKLVPAGNEKNINYNYTNQKFLNVTESNVPFLLSMIKDRDFSMNEAGTIITGSSEVYVREDKYEEFLDSIENGINYTDLGFDYYSEELGENTDYILSESEKQTVMSLVKSTPIQHDFEERYGYLHLFQQSDNALFRKQLYSVIKDNGKNYLVEYEHNVEDYVLQISKVYASTPQADKLFELLLEKGNPGFCYYY